MKLWRIFKIEGSVLMFIAPPLGLAYVGERRTTFANICIRDKREVLKWRTYWEPIRNLEGTLWK
jgi:hypothetical protein